VIFTRLGLACRNGPERTLQIEFGLFGPAQLPGPNEHVWSELHCDLGDRLSLVTVDGPQQLAHPNGIYNGPELGKSGRDQRPTKARVGSEEAGWSG